MCYAALTIAAGLLAIAIQLSDTGNRLEPKRMCTVGSGLITLLKCQGNNLPTCGVTEEALQRTADLYQ